MTSKFEMAECLKSLSECVVIYLVLSFIDIQSLCSIFTLKFLYAKLNSFYMSSQNYSPLQAWPISSISSLSHYALLMRSETVFQRPKSTVRLRFSSSKMTVQLQRTDTSQFPVHGNGSLTGLRRGACICIWLPLLGEQNGFMVSLSPGEQLMRVRRLAASEWGNSTRYPSNGRRGVVVGGVGGVVEGGHIPH